MTSIRRDANDEAARATFARLLDAARPIWTTSFVLLETMALLQHRIGIAAAHDFDEEICRSSASIGWMRPSIVAAPSDSGVKTAA